MTLSEICKLGEKILKDSKINYTKNDVYLIFKHCFNLNRIDLIINKNNNISDSEEVNKKKFFKMIKKRANNEPLQYILGRWEFMNLKFNVGKGVLIPREDTEVLVNTAFKFIERIKKPKIVDLCSGSGCIAISLDKMLKDSEIYAIEFYPKAFFYLNKNIKLHKSRVKALNEDALSNLNLNLIDAIVSNPPYINTADLKKLQKEVKKEPRSALDGGINGLYFYKKICKLWVPKLKKEGFVAFEIGINQKNNVKKIMVNSGLKNIKIQKDINGIDRVIIGFKI